MVRTKKQMFIIISAFALILFLGGTTYAWFSYRAETGSNEVIAGDIYLTMTEGNETLTLINTFPETKNQARSRNDNYITFAVNGLNESNKDMYYEIVINHGEDKPSPKSRYNDSDLMFDLIELDSNGNEVKYVVNGESYDTIVNKSIWFDSIEANTDSNVGKRYKLRVWLSEKVIISDSEPNANYNTTEFINKYATVKVSVRADMTHRDRSCAYEMLKSNADASVQIDFARISSGTNGEGLYLLPGTGRDDYPVYYYRGNINNNNVIFGGFCWQIVRTTDTGGIKMIYNGEVTGDGTTCENTAHADRVLPNESRFNAATSMARAGYMYNVDYLSTRLDDDGNGLIYGKNVQWDGTNYLVIEDTPGVASSNTTKDYDHHYSCGTSGVTSCQEVRYYYQWNFYETLSNGELLDDILYKMTGNGSQAIKGKYASYNLNVNSSSVKSVIDSWFRTYLTDEVDENNRDYRTYLEDTIFCNDRSFKTVEGNVNYPPFAESGRNPNGGSFVKITYFGILNRYRNDWYSTTNVPVMECSNETDKFTVDASNGNGALTYPVGLLTGDEVVMAGANGNSNNNAYYLYTGGAWWTMSPYASGNNNVDGLIVDGNGAAVSYYMGNTRSVRPVISLKYGTEFEDGDDGTPTSPYVVKY